MNEEELVKWHTDRLKEQAVPMNPEVKKLLVDALRSGDYPQTRGYLQVKEPVESRQPGFCCLGVLSEVAVSVDAPNVFKEDRPCHNGLVVEYFEKYNDDVPREVSTTQLIHSVTEWSGMDETVASCLMGINDNGGSFDLIADLVEEYL